MLPISVMKVYSGSPYLCSIHVEQLPILPLGSALPSPYITLPLGVRTPGWFLRAECADRSQPLARIWRRTLLFARRLSRLRRSGSLRLPSCRETSGLWVSRVGFGPIFAGRSKPFVTVGIASDADLQEGLSRLRLSGSFRILFLRKV